MAITLDSIVPTVYNLERSIEFYRDKLGMPVRYKSKRFVALDAGTVPLQLESVDEAAKTLGLKLFLHNNKLGTGWHLQRA